MPWIVSHGACLPLRAARLPFLPRRAAPALAVRAAPSSLPATPLHCTAHVGSVHTNKTLIRIKRARHDARQRAPDTAPAFRADALCVGLYRRNVAALPLSTSMRIVRAQAPQRHTGMRVKTTATSYAGILT